MAEKNWFVQYLPQILIAVGVLLTAIGGWISFSRMIEYRAENIRLAKENLDLNAENLKSTNEVKQISETNTELSEKNIQLTAENQVLSTTNQGLIKDNIEIANSNVGLSNELLKASEVITSEITGGKSYLKIQVNYQDAFNNIAIFTHNVGEFSIKNILVSVSKDNQVISQNKIPEINRNDSRVVELVKVSNQPKTQFYEIMVKTRNGNYKQYVLIKNVDGFWHHHYIYFEDGNAKWFREEEFKSFSAKKMQAATYPEILKNESPIMSDYVDYQKDNKKSIQVIEDLINSSGNPSNKEISKSTYTPLWIVEQIRNGNYLNK